MYVFFVSLYVVPKTIPYMICGIGCRGLLPGCHIFIVYSIICSPKKEDSVDSHQALTKISYACFMWWHRVVALKSTTGTWCTIIMYYYVDCNNNECDTSLAYTIFCLIYWEFIVDIFIIKLTWYWYSLGWGMPCCILGISVKVILGCHIFWLNMVSFIVHYWGGDPCFRQNTIDEFMQERRNSIAYALELHRSCTNPLTWRPEQNSSYQNMAYFTPFPYL